MARPSHRNRQIVRQWELLMLLGRRRWTVIALARELGVTVRTVYRDLAAVEEAHFLIVQDDRGYGLLGERVNGIPARAIPPVPPVQSVGDGHQQYALSFSAGGAR